MVEKLDVPTWKNIWPADIISKTHLPSDGYCHKCPFLAAEIIVREQVFKDYKHYFTRYTHVFKDKKFNGIIFKILRRTRLPAFSIIFYLIN